MTCNLAIEVTLSCPDWSRACPASRRLAHQAARAAFLSGNTAPGMSQRARIELGIILADDTEQRRLNRVYRGRDAPTNVLSFPALAAELHAPVGVPLLLGDVVLGFETAAREAAEQGKPLADHLRHLVVHGVLHLLGHDHEVEAEAVAMEALEASILARLGVSDPYRDTM